MVLLHTTQHATPAYEGLSNVLIVAIVLLLYGIYRSYFQKKKDGFIQFIRYFLLPFTFLSGFVIYFIGYQFGDPEHHVGWRIFPNILDSAFSTTRLFILNTDLAELKAPFKHDALFHAMFSLTTVSVAFIFVSFIIHVFFKDWLIRTKIRRTNAGENHFFFGINRSALQLSTDLLKNNRNRLVVFVNDLREDENRYLYAEVPGDAYVIKRKSFSESISLEQKEGVFQFLQNKNNYTYSTEHTDNVFYNVKILKDKMNKADTHLYFLTDDEDWNIQYARYALNALTGNPCAKQVRIHVVTYTGISDKHFAEWSKLSVQNISVMIHHYASIVSRQLIEEHPPVDSVEIDPVRATAKSDFNTLLIGFGRIGTSVLRKLIEHGQFAGSTFHATIIDKCMNNLQGRFEHLYPGVIANYDLHFVEAEIGHSRFYKEIKNVIEKTNYTVIASGNDDLNIRTALEILEIEGIKNKNLLKIFIQLECESHWNETLKDIEEHIFIFGESRNVFSEENILQGKSESRGRKIHDVYNDLIYPDPNKPKPPFDTITRHEQLSNISSAEHLYAKIRLLGYKNLDDFSNNYMDNDDFKKHLSSTQKLNLSITEHLRWNAFHFIHGWTTISFKELPETEKYKNRKNTSLRKHACLTSWKKLKELGDILEKDMQEPDVVSIENLYNFIHYHTQNDTDAE